jgi:hypothetical protein
MNFLKVEVQVEHYNAATGNNLREKNSFSGKRSIGEARSKKITALTILGADGLFS